MPKKNGSPSLVLRNGRQVQLVVAKNGRARSALTGLAGIFLAGNVAFVQTALAAQTEHAAQTVQSLRYGASLFHFYQHDYFGALTELMVGQKVQDLGPHAPGAELLRGGMSLSYGMDRTAENIFHTLLDEAPFEVDKDQAWFYLGKIAWQRGEVDRADAALAELSPEYDGALADEVRYMRAAALVRENETAAATDILYQLPKASNWRYYLHYNLGAARAAQGDWAAAQAHFEPFDTLPLESEEAWALYDKAQTASAYAYLAAREFELAQEVFQRVRLESSATEKALLGYGWSSAEQGDYQAALSPWQALTQRSMLDASARESLLAVPYAYEQLGRPGIALTQYRAASDIYSSQLEGLHSAIEAFRTQDIAQLLGVPNDDSGDWLFAPDILPRGEFAPYLQYLISRHGFQVALRELRDLYATSQRLQDAAQRVGVLHQVDQHQQATWSKIAREDRREQMVSRQAIISAQAVEVRERLERALSSTNGRQLGGAAQLARWSKVERSTQLAAELEDSTKQEKIRLLRGLLIWDDNELYPARAWELQQQLHTLDQAVSESSVALARLDEALAQRNVSSFAPRIEAISERVTIQAQQLASVVAVAEEQVRQLAVVELEQQAQQMARALGQSGLAIARLYDLGSEGAAP